ncbi:MAG: hypothetical protein AB2A00_07780 [Myxococcota bacterium]
MSSVRRLSPPVRNQLLLLVVLTVGLLAAAPVLVVALVGERVEELRRQRIWQEGLVVPARVVRTFHDDGILPGPPTIELAVTVEGRVQLVQRNAFGTDLLALSEGQVITARVDPAEPTFLALHVDDEPDHFHDVEFVAVLFMVLLIAAASGWGLRYALRRWRVLVGGEAHPFRILRRNPFFATLYEIEYVVAGRAYRCWADIPMVMWPAVEIIPEGVRLMVNPGRPRQCAVATPDAFQVADDVTTHARALSPLIRAWAMGTEEADVRQLLHHVGTRMEDATPDEAERCFHQLNELLDHNAAASRAFERWATHGAVWRTLNVRQRQALRRLRATVTLGRWVAMRVALLIAFGGTTISVVIMSAGFSVTMPLAAAATFFAALFVPVYLMFRP